MSEKTIYQTLRDGGLSPCGACAMMGNMWAESGLKSDNVQDNCPMGDKDYTYNVEHGIISKWQFMTDSFGYGLCQWTYSTRKVELYEFAKRMGVPISDEKMQCDFCLEELRRDYSDLYGYLCTTDDLPKATERICAEFERPAVNNFSVRINAAQRYFNQLTGSDSGCGEDSCPIEIPANEICDVKVRSLRQGDLGRDVFLLQCGLQDMGINCGLPDGDFGLNTKEAVMTLQRDKGLNPTGIADSSVWEIILTVR